MNPPTDGNELKSCPIKNYLTVNYENQTKRCGKCMEFKPFSEFHRNPRKRHGCKSYCKSCEHNRQLGRKEYHRNRFRRLSEKEISRVEEWRNKKRSVGERYWIDFNYDKQKSKARSKLTNALKSGVLKKADACEECRSSESIEGHHTDYNQPLLVTWLCRRCHAKKRRK